MNTSNDKIYELVDRTRRELKEDIIRLSDRLDKIDEDVSRLRVTDATQNTKIYVLVFIVSSVVSSAIAAFVPKVIR